MNNEDKILELLGTLITEVGSLKEGQKELRQDVATLKEGQAKLKKGQAKLEQGQAKLEEKLEDTRNIVTRIEHDHGEKIQAALDGYTMLYDISKQTQSDVEYLKSKQEEQDLHITALKTKKVQ